jgi:hypothetical protein
MTRTKDPLIDPVRVKLFGERLRREIPGAKNAILIFAPESNYGKESGWLKVVLECSQVWKDGSIILPMQRYHVLHKDRGYAGIRTDNTNKRDAALSLKSYVDSGSLMIHKNAYSSHPEGWTAIAYELSRQMKVFRRKVHINKKSFKETETFDGKDSGCDDLVIALMLAFYSHNNYSMNIDHYEHRDPVPPALKANFII